MRTCPRYRVLGAIGKDSSCGRPAIHEIVFVGGIEREHEIRGAITWVCLECLPIYLDDGWSRIEDIPKDQVK